MNPIVGIGLRPPHYPALLNLPQPKLGVLEVISENYMNTKGRPLTILRRLAQDYPILLHGVSLSIGSIEKIKIDYLKNLRKLINDINPILVSDHFCWTTVGGQNIHDLLPIPFTQKMLNHICQKIDQVQSFLKRNILLENISSYFTYSISEMEEWEFINEVAKKSGCYLLLDINNLYVNSQNHGFDPKQFLEKLDWKKVKQIHLAGHTNQKKFLFDTHSTPISPPVWNLYAYAQKFISQEYFVIIERDENIPDYKTLEKEALYAKNITQKHENL